MLRQVDRRTFDEIRSRLFSERDRVRMNLFELIEGGDAPLLGTDGASILFGQSNDHAPLWLWLRKMLPQTRSMKLRRFCMNVPWRTPDYTSTLNRTPYSPRLSCCATAMGCVQKSSCR